MMKKSVRAPWNRLALTVGLVLGWLPFAGAAAASDTNVMVLPFHPNSLAAMDLDTNGTVRLARDIVQTEKGQPVLSIEAEGMGDSEGQALPAAAVHQDQAASGGAYVAEPKALSVRFEVATAGDYVLAARIRHPAEISFQYTLASGAAGKWKNNQAQTNWSWVPFQPVALKAGVQRLALDFQNAAKTGYARMDIDKLLIYPRTYRFKDKDAELEDLLSDAAGSSGAAGSADGLPGALPSLPRGKGPAESPRGYASAGTVSFAVLDLADGFAFLRLQPEADAADGSITWRLRESPEAEWRPCLPDVELRDTPTNRLELSAVVTHGTLSHTPVIKTVRGAFRTDPDRLLTLENRHASFVFAKINGNLLGIRQKNPDRWLTLFPLRRPLYAVQVFDAAQKTVRPLDTPWIVEGVELAADRLTVRQSAAAGKIGLTGTFIMDDSPLVRWTIQIRNDSTQDIRRIDAALPFLAFSSSDALPQLVMPSGLWGRGLGSRMTFPGSAAMGWMDYHDGQGGISLTVHDPGWNMTGIGAPACGGRPFAGYEVGHWYPVGTGATYSVELALGIHPGDWHWTADRYREWTTPLLARPDHPAWLAGAHGWCYLPGESVLLFRKSSDFLPDAQWLGLPFGQYWANNVDEVNCGIHPFFDPRLGTAEAMRRDAKVLRRKSGHAGYYLCCFRWHPDFADGDRLGLNYKKFLPPDLRIESKEWAYTNASKAPNGRILHSPAVECYETETATAMCTASAGWAEHLLYWMKQWAETFGVDCAYFDGGGIHDDLCFDESHPHGKNPGLGPRGMAEIMKRTIATGRKANPDFVTAMEGMSAVVGQYCDINLSSSSPSDDFGKEYLYTFPDRLVYRGDGNGCSQWTGLSRRDFLMSVFVFHRYDLGLQPQDYLYLKDILALRDRVADWMYRGRFMDDVGLTVPAPADPARRAPRAKWFRYDRDGDQGAVITFDNPQEAAVREPLRLDHGPAAPPAAGLIYNLGGDCQVFAPQVVDGRIQLPVITNRLSAILLVDRIAPERSLRLHAAQQLEKGPDGIRVWLCNLSAQPRAIALHLDDSAAFTPSPAMPTLALPELSATNLFLAIPGLPRLAERTWLTLTATENGQTAGSTRLLVAPPLHNRGFELDENGDGSPDDWFNRNNLLYHEVVRFCHSIDPLSLVCKLDDAVASAGKRSLRLDGTVAYTVVDEREPGLKYLVFHPWGQGERTWVKEVTQMAILKPDTAYTLTARVRRQSPTTPYHIVLTEDAGQAAGAQTLLDLKDQPADPTGAWFDVHGRFTNAPCSAVRFVSLRGGLPAAPVWFDQVELEEEKK